MMVLPHFVSVPRRMNSPGAPIMTRLSLTSFSSRRLGRQKRAQDLIQLFKTYRKALLWIVGDGDDAPVRERAKGLAHVRFFGSIPSGERAGFYRRALTVIVPSLCYETLVSERG
jgi:glycosyltransferase involved in cell wall biosynthesis